jgi:hypothetical protein
VYSGRRKIHGENFDWTVPSEYRIQNLNQNLSGQLRGSQE